VSTAANSSVDQVFDVLAVLSASQEPIGVAQLARTLNVPTSTAHRVLATLQEAGYVARDTTGTKYQLGLGAQELTHALLRRFPLQTASQPFLRRLAAATGDTVVLTCRVGWYGVRMAGTEGWREIHSAPRLGQTTPLHGTPGGRAILAFLDEATREGYLRWRAGGKRATAAVRAIRADVEVIREHGHVLDHGAEGRSDIALPLLDGAGEVAASIAIEAAEPDGGARAERTRISRARAVAAELEALLNERPELAIDPFEHLPSQELDPGFEIAGPG
jgi:IclR family transcriptional regulator, acetate operon repressor